MDWAQEQVALAIKGTAEGRVGWPSGRGVLEAAGLAGSRPPLAFFREWWEQEHVFG